MGPASGHVLQGKEQDAPGAGRLETPTAAQRLSEPDQSSFRCEGSGTRQRPRKAGEPPGHSPAADRALRRTPGLNAAADAEYRSWKTHLLRWLKKYGNGHYYARLTRSFPGLNQPSQ